MSALTDMGKFIMVSNCLQMDAASKSLKTNNMKLKGLSHTGKHFLSSFPVCKILARLFAKL